MSSVPATTRPRAGLTDRVWWIPARGVARFLLIAPQIALFVIAVYAVPLITVGVGLVMLPLAVLGIRALARFARSQAARWGGVSIQEPYRPQPRFAGGLRGLWQRNTWILRDPATWRELLWCLLDPIIGGILALLPATLLVYGLEGVAMPFIWESINGAGGNEWYVGIPERNATLALVSVPVGLVLFGVGLAAGPALSRAHARWGSSLLAPTTQATLRMRVDHLTSTRTDAVDTQAAELRRIERDLHDGAQARLVAMGMNLGAAEALLSSDPDAARALLAETREASAKALNELRDLVRGIHPPVLADRGLVDAVRSLALESPLDVQVEARLAGRLEPPLESAAYFAVCEVLTNAAKHSGARRVWVELRPEERRGGDVLCITVTDDGRGGARLESGSGLRGIERRLGTFDGSLSLRSPRGGPTMVTMELPCVLSSPKISPS